MEAEVEAEVAIDLTHVGYMPDNMTGASAGTMKMGQTTVQIDPEVVVAEAANRIGVEAGVLDAITITITQAEAISKITMVATVRARYNNNMNNIIMNKADCLSQMAP